MLFGFRPRFVDPIIAGTKDQTIRRERKDGKRPRVGEQLFLYTGLRTKQSRKIGEAVCSEVLSITIKGAKLILNGVILAPSQLDKLARRDGFKDYTEFIEFFQKMHGDEPFHGFVTRWKEFEPHGH